MEGMCYERLRADFALLLRTIWRWTKSRPGAQADRTAVAKAPLGSTPSAARLLHAHGRRYSRGPALCASAMRPPYHLVLSCRGMHMANEQGQCKQWQNCH
jgi:hypothetical protein